MTIDPNNLAGTAVQTFNEDFNSLNLWTGPGSPGVWSTNWWYKDEWGLFDDSNGSTLTNNGELQWYINDNFAPTSAVNPWSVSNGVLTIKAEPADAAIRPLIDNYAYTSGMLNSWHAFSQQYGYFEISAQLPRGQGLWPAFWLLPQDGSWPPEIDIFEAIGSKPDYVYTTIHTNQTGAHTQSGKEIKTVDLTAGYHSYGVNWQADKITFYLDRQPVYEVATPADMHKPFYMIVNLAVGGSWAGAPDGSTPWPAELKVDYIRAYKAAPGGAAAPAENGTWVNGWLMYGDGPDTVAGSGGQDVLGGGGGDDRLEGGGAFDNLNGNAGNDTVSGGDGDDWVLGGRDNDTLFGEIGNDYVHGNMGSDTLRGSEGADTLRGGQGEDHLFGDNGPDLLFGDRGADTLWGGDGSDTYVAFSGSGRDVIMDFNVWNGDRVKVEGSGWNVSQSGSDVLVDLGGGDQLVLANTHLDWLTGGWIFGG